MPAEHTGQAGITGPYFGALEVIICELADGSASCQLDSFTKTLQHTGAIW